MSAPTASAKTYGPPIAVGALLCLYGVAMLLIADEPGDVAPLVLLALLLGAAAVGYGLWRRERARTD